MCKICGEDHPTKLGYEVQFDTETQTATVWRVTPTGDRESNKPLVVFGPHNSMKAVQDLSEMFTIVLAASEAFRQIDKWAKSGEN